MVVSWTLMAIHSISASSADWDTGVQVASDFTSVARPWCLFLVNPARVKPGSFRMELLTWWVSWIRTTVALLLVTICSRMVSLAVVTFDGRDRLS